MVRLPPSRIADIQAGNREQALIWQHFAPLVSERGARRLTDDAASIRHAANQELVITTDTVIANVHFPPSATPEAIAAKALRVNLSDLAAKGAKPRCYLLNIALSAQQDAVWTQRFAAGLKAEQEIFGITLIGGDTVNAPGALTITITAIGIVPRGGMITRSGAKPGNLIFLSGTIGDAALGLDLAIGRPGPADLLADGERSWLFARYQIPTPRLALAPALRKYATAAMDISDGLAGDLDQLCRASNVTTQIPLKQVPLSPPAKKCRTRDSAIMTRLVTAGDDYEILCTVAARNAPGFVRAARTAKVPVSEIGRIQRGDATVTFLRSDGSPVDLGELSYSHI